MRTAALAGSTAAALEPDGARTELIHASAVEIGGRAAMIVGPSGSGKSGLALDLMSRGARLVSDDSTLAVRRKDRVELSAPDSIRGRIEARSVGILRADATLSADLAVVVDMGSREPERLPPRRAMRILGLEIDLLRGAESPNLAAAVLQYLKSGRET